MHFDGLSFIFDGGIVSIVVAIMLLVMSVLSWYFAIAHALRIYKQRREISHYVERFWQTNQLAKAMDISDVSGMDGIVKRAVAASQHHQNINDQVALDVCNKDEFIARAMNRALNEKAESYQYGLTLLASVGSISPFVGLFGTVWGIYHALISISQSGQATLDKVAGPVGEALVMTAIGLAVAIPAVLAYNAILQANRMLLNQIEQFCEELHILLSTGRVMQQFDVRKITKDALHVVEKTA
ncbi:MAG: MotA/TolQ/ExbB proton channel family protein [Sulfuritalea sp.]|nr:MotA/TolQ/ExbB proton channel family protein [Sulfuritalea sp.]